MQAFISISLVVFRQTLSVSSEIIRNQLEELHLFWARVHLSQRAFKSSWYIYAHEGHHSNRGHVTKLGGALCHL